MNFYQQNNQYLHSIVENHPSNLVRLKKKQIEKNENIKLIIALRDPGDIAIIFR
jgi:hypothetical protein